jgi:hypothetical protein
MSTRGVQTFRSIPDDAYPPSQSGCFIFSFLPAQVVTRTTHVGGAATPRVDYRSCPERSGKREAGKRVLQVDLATEIVKLTTKDLDGAAPTP